MIYSGANIFLASWVFIWWRKSLCRATKKPDGATTLIKLLQMLHEKGAAEGWRA